MADIENMRKELNRMLDMEEAMWHKRTHIAWLKQATKTLSFSTLRHQAGTNTTYFWELQISMECGKRM